MSGSAVILNLAGAVALLLVAVRLVRAAVEQGFGPVLRQRLRTILDRPLLALTAGAGLGVAFQSATAVTLLVAALVATGSIGGLGGLAAVLGADIGSAAAVALLSLDVQRFAPGFLLLGAILFLSERAGRTRQIGQAVIGVGLMLLSLRLIGEASAPLQQSTLLPPILRQAAGDPVAGFMGAALLTVAFHSSVAAILLFVTLAERGLLPAELATAAILGANLGSGLVGMLVARRMEAAPRQIPLGNLLLRGGGAGLALATVLLVDPRPDWLAPLGSTLAGRMVALHVGFNLCIAAAGLALAPLLLRSARWLLGGSAPQTPATALDEGALERPRQALGNARREAVGLCETLDAMLVGVGEALARGARPEELEAIRKQDDNLDARHRAIKLYLARLGGAGLSAEEEAERQELMGACVKLEQAGDVIVHGLLPLAEKKAARGLSFTPEGAAEIAAFHQSVLDNSRLAFTLLVSRNVEAARRLVEEKERLREREATTSFKHFSRLADGTRASLETSAIHLDAIRDLKHINGLLSFLAHPVLAEHGLLRRSRLKAR